jgi:hypothetical protein
MHLVVFLVHQGAGSSELVNPGVLASLNGTQYHAVHLRRVVGSNGAIIRAIL